MGWRRQSRKHGTNLLPWSCDQRTPVEFLRLILPRLEPMRENSKILSDPARSDRDHSVAALQILQDLCVSFETF
jgi:hypothetical protein